MNNYVPREGDLTFEERQVIEQNCKAGISINRTRIQLGRSAYAIQFEVRRNGGPSRYNAMQAHGEYLARAENRVKRNRSEFSEEEIENVKRLIGEGKNKNQICKFLNIGKGTLNTLIKNNFINYQKLDYQSISSRFIALEEQIKLLFEILEEQLNGKN